MNAKKPITLLITIFFISPIISAQSFEDFFEGVLDAFAESPLYQKYADSAVNYSSLVERQGIKYQVNSNTPFSGNYIMYVWTITHFVSKRREASEMESFMDHWKVMKDVVWLTLIKLITAMA